MAISERRLVRTFVALDLPQDRLPVLGAYLERASALAPGFAFEDARDLHLTLCFCGGLEMERLAALRAGLRRLTFNPFEIELGGIALFGRREAAKSLHLALQRGRDDVVALAESVSSVCLAAGIAVDMREVRPHLTFARARGQSCPAVPPLPRPPRLSPWLAKDFVLFESRLSERPRYRAIERYPAHL